MDGRTYSPTRITVSAILVVAAAMLLVAAALAGPTRSAAASGPAAAGKVGGTLRVNLSTTDVQYTDPSLEYESTGWQVEYATNSRSYKTQGDQESFHNPVLLLQLRLRPITLLRNS